MGWSDAPISLPSWRPPTERVAKLVVFGGQSFLTQEEIVAFNNIRKIANWSPRAAKPCAQLWRRTG